MEQTQCADKRPIEEPTGKGKKVAKKADRANDMTIALQEYIALARERFNKKNGKSMGSSNHVAQFAIGGDPCSLGRALEVLNQYNDLDDDTYINISEGRMVSLNDPFWTFDFDNAYFDSNDDGMENSGCGDDMDVSDCDHDMDVSNCDHDMDIDANTDSDYDSEEDEFWIVFPLVSEMVAYFQRHYDKRPMRTSILSGKDYMDEVGDGNPTNCHDMFCMTLNLFYHLVDELKHHGYLKEEKRRVDMQEAIAIFFAAASALAAALCCSLGCTGVAASAVAAALCCSLGCTGGS
nr:hypothetical protein CFP56_22632 [Quercus suber]